MANMGSLVADMALRSASFQRNLSRAAQHLKSEAAKMRKSLREVETASRGVTRSMRQVRAGVAALVGALAVRQFKQFTTAAIESADALAKQSRRIGLTSEALQRFRIEGELAGVSIEQMDSAAAQFIKKVGELRSGTGTLNIFLDKYNAALKEQILQSRTSAEAIDVMLAAVRAAGNDFDRVALSAAAFGRTAGTNMVLIADAAGQLSQEMVDLVSRSDEMLAAAERLNDETTLLQRAFEAGFDSGIILQLNDAVEASVDGMRQARQVGEQLGNAVGLAMRGLAAAVAWVARNMRELVAVIAALAAAKAAAMFIAIAVSVARLAGAVALAAKGVRALSFAMRANLLTAVAQIAAMAAAAALAYEAFGMELDDVIDQVSEMAAAIEGGATPAVSENTKQIETAIAAMSRERDELEALKDAHLGLGLSVEKTTDLIEARRKLDELGLNLTDKEGELVYDLVIANNELRRSIEGITEAQERRRQAEEERKREAQARAEEEARIMQQPFLNAIDGIQSSFVDMFEDIISGGVNSFADLAAAVKRIMIRLAAEVATLLVFRPVVGSVLGAAGFGGIASSLGATSSSLGLGGLGSLFGLGGGTTSPTSVPGYGGGMFELLNNFGANLGFARPGLGGLPAGAGPLNNIVPEGIFGTTTFTQFLGGAGLGFGAGALLNSLLGGNSTGGMVGSGVGGLAGAVAGSFVGQPVLGGLLGGALGGFIGGLFGGDGKTVGPNAFGRIRNTAGRLVVGGGAQDNNGNLAQALALAKDVTQNFNAYLDLIGASVVGKPISYVGSFGGRLGVRAGAYNAGRFDRYFDDYQSAVSGSTLYAFERAKLEGVDPALAAAVQRAAKISEDLEDFAKNVNVAKAILDGSIFEQENLTQAEEALKELNAQFDEAAKRAEALGLSVKRLEELRQQSIAEMTTGFDDAVRLAILAITDPAAAALEELLKSQEQRVREAKVLGADLVAVERLNMLERQRVLEQQSSALLDFYNEITFGTLSGADPTGTLSGSRAAFEAAVAQGASGSRLVNLGGAYLEASRAFNASSGGYFADLARVQDVIGGRLAGGNEATAAAIANASDRSALDAARIVDQLRAGGESSERIEALLEDILRQLKEAA